ncbi:MAG TPA: formate dehydrogenase subunit gamma [Caulobacteraceae bacterium]|nr:formate dehydrogenase subunit gamma [Caulobacteraceae bacterium]
MNRPFDPARAAEIIEAHAHLEGALLPVLRALADEFGWIPDEAAALAAEQLNLSRAEVHGAVTFYHDFRREPPGRHVLRLCRAEACQARGGREVEAQAKAALGLDFGDTSADGAITLEAAYCLGLCASGPAAMFDGRPMAGLTGDRLEQLIASSRDATNPLSSPSGGSPAGGRDGGLTRVFVPKDAAARAVGADEVAAALEEAARTAGRPIEIVRTGSRGLFRLETLVEVETPEGRIGYGPVRPEDVPGLIEAGMLDGGEHPLRIGRPEALPFFARQQRLTFARCGVVDPKSLDDYRAHGGLAGLEAARRISREEIVTAIQASRLRGRGGAGFPAGIKWDAVRRAEGKRKFVVVNADEGDSGTFADRMLMEGDPFGLIEGMLIAALAVGANKGFVYIRSEYPDAVAAMTAAVEVARESGLLADFPIEIRIGAGAYVCGEETAMLESLEGRRGQVRAKPPLPAHAGLFGEPTLIHNVLTLAAAPTILAEGAGDYADLGFGRSRGTITVQLAGDVRNGGLFETPFGITLGELVNDIGGGTQSGRPVRAVQVGGPLGAYFPPSLFDTPFDYEAFLARDGLIGHAGVVVFAEGVDMARQARFAFEFCAAESCGKCTPCRIGAVRGAEAIDAILQGPAPEASLELVKDLCETMKYGSLCALGGLTPLPVLSALKHFPEDFARVRSRT